MPDEHTKMLEVFEKVNKEIEFYKEGLTYGPECIGALIQILSDFWQDMAKRDVVE